MELRFYVGFQRHPTQWTIAATYKKGIPSIQTNATCPAPITWDGKSDVTFIFKAGTTTISNMNPGVSVTGWKISGYSDDGKLTSPTSGNSTAAYTWSFTVPTSSITGNSITINMNALAVATLSDGTTARGQAACPVTIASNPPQPTPSATPAPVNPPPTAMIVAPDTVKQGQATTVSASGSHDYKNTTNLTYQWYWYEAYADGSNGPVQLGGTSLNDTMTFPDQGKVWVIVGVTDQWGGSAQASKQIIVKPPKPTAVVNVSGDRKEYRDLFIDGSGSSTPTSYPITSRQFSITPMFGASAGNIVTFGTLTRSTSIHAMFKVSGTYKVSYTVTNSLGYTDTASLVVDIAQDQAPVAVLNAPTIIYRDPAMGNAATIKLKDLSYSLDADLLSSLYGTVTYDVNNNNTYNQTIGTFTVDVNSRNKSLSYGNVGKYRIQYYAKETFDPGVFSAQVPPSAYKVSPVLTFDFTVDNLPPYTSLTGGKRYKVDLVINVGNLSASEVSYWQSNYYSYIRNNLLAKNIDASLSFHTWDTLNNPNYQSDANNFINTVTLRSGTDGKYFVGATNNFGDINNVFGNPQPPINLKLIPVTGSGLSSAAGTFSNAVVNNNGDVYAAYQQSDGSYRVYNNNNWGYSYSTYVSTPVPASGYSSGVYLNIDDVGKPWAWIWVPSDPYYGQSYVLYDRSLYGSLASESNFPSRTSQMSNINGNPTLWTATVQTGYGFAQERALYFRSRSGYFNEAQYAGYQALNVTDQYEKGFYLQGHTIWIGEHNSNYWPAPGETSTVNLIYRIDGNTGSNYNYSYPSYPWTCGNNLCFFSSKPDGWHKVTMSPVNGSILGDVVVPKTFDFSTSIKKIDNASQFAYQINGRTVTKLDLANLTVVWRKTFAQNILDVALVNGAEYYLFQDPYQGKTLFYARENDPRNPPAGMSIPVHTNGRTQRTYYSGSGAYAYVNGDGKFVKVASDGTTKTYLLPSKTIDSDQQQAVSYSIFLDAAGNGVFLDTDPSGNSAYWLETENFSVEHKFTGLYGWVYYQTYVDPPTEQVYLSIGNPAKYYRWDSATSTPVEISTLPTGLIAMNGIYGNSGVIPTRTSYSFSGNLTNDPIFKPSGSVDPGGNPIGSPTGPANCEFIYGNSNSMFFSTSSMRLYDYANNKCTVLTDTVPTAAGYTPTFSSPRLQIGFDDLVVLARSNSGNGYAIYRVNNADQWTLVRSLPAAYSTYSMHGFTQDEEGNIFFVYYKNTGGSTITVETNYGGSWQTFDVNVGLTYPAGIRASNGTVAILAGSSYKLNVFDVKNSNYTTPLLSLVLEANNLKGMTNFYFDRASKLFYAVSIGTDYDDYGNGTNYDYIHWDNGITSGMVRNVSNFKVSNGKIIFDGFAYNYYRRTIQHVVDSASGVEIEKGGISYSPMCTPYSIGYMSCYSNPNDILYPVINMDGNLPTFANTLGQKGIKTIFTGNGIQADVQPFVDATGGTFFNYTSGQTVMDSIIQYVDTDVKSAGVGKANYFVVGDTITYTPTYQDAEGDPKQAERWKYVHDPSVFDNSNGTLAQNNQYISSPITTFSQVGKYTVTYSAEDKVSNATFSKWSPDSGSFVFYIHRKPVASFNATLHTTADPNRLSATIHDSSYDLDHSVSDTVNKGIASRTFQWKDVNDGTWTLGQPSQLLVNHTYMISEIVTDLEGASSDPYILNLTTSPGSVTPNNPPSANITVPASTNSATPTVFNTLRPTIQWAYSDPDGDTQAIYHVDIYDYSNNLVYSSNDVASNATSYLNGINLTDKTNYYATVKVNDGMAWSTVSAKKYFRIQLNTAPSAVLSYPTGTSTSPTIATTQYPTIQWNQTDPDAVTIFKAYQVVIQNASGTTIQDSGAVPQWTSSTSGSWKVPLALPTGQNLQVYVRVYDGTDWSLWSPAGWMKINRAPTGNISYAAPIYRHDTPSFTVTQSDPDGDALNITVEASFNGGAFTAIQSWSAVPSGSSKTFAYGPLNQGSYTLRLTLNDGKGGIYVKTYSFAVQPLAITGSIRHTAEWESNRQRYNQANPDSPRTAGTFWAGERLELAAVATDTSTSTRPLRVRATLLQTGDSVWMSGSDMVHFAAELWNEKLERLDDGIYTIRFQVDWSNGLTETTDAAFRILGSIYDFFVPQLRN